ncbi:MAG: DMT family transporter [Candidatus Rokubacteria bacterium]|nr:DMT family transporter [Candidatus Rokubacteria bacterium]MBI3827829.1 DMT family transporter [Candidatus Rokubacteria bacterium]
MALVGSSIVVGKTLVERCPVFLLGTLRFAVASLVLVPVVVVARRGGPAPRVRDLAVLALQAFAGIFAFNALLLSGLRYTSAAEAGIVTSTTPALGALLSVVLLRERPTLAKAAALGLAVLGIAAVSVGPHDAARGAQPVLGNLLVFGAVVGEALYLVCGKVVSARLTPLAVATGNSALGLAMFLPFGLAEARGYDFAALGPGGWTALAYYGVVVSALAVPLWARGIARVPASTAAVFTSVMPVSAVGLSYVALGEPVLWSHLAGGACVVAAIVVSARAG